MLRIGAVFGIFLGTFFHFSFLTGIRLNRLFEAVFFLSFFVGVNLTFIPLHFAGLQGSPRKYRDRAQRYSKYHALSSVGGTLVIVCLAFLIYLFLEALMS